MGQEGLSMGILHLFEVLGQERGRGNKRDNKGNGCSNYLFDPSFKF